MTEIIDLTGDDYDTDSAFSATTIPEDGSTDADNNTSNVINTNTDIADEDDIADQDDMEKPIFVINLKEKNSFRAFLFLETFPDEFAQRVTSDNGHWFIPVYPYFNGIIRRTFRLAKSGHQQCGSSSFSFFVLSTIKKVIREGQFWPDPSFTMLNFCTTLLEDSRFPSDLATVVVRDWDRRHFLNELMSWEMVTGVKKLIDAARTGVALPRVHLDVEALKFD